MSIKLERILGIEMKQTIYRSLFALFFAASSPALLAHGTDEVQVFYSYESNGDDYISGVGIGYTFADPHSKLGYQLTTSLNNAEVVATDGFIEDYIAWEGGIKLGLFSNLSLYVEAGIDLSEILFHDLRYDEHDYYFSEYHDDFDAYIGVGAGIQAGPLRVTAFSRKREIDSKYWEAESEVFSGVQFSISF